MRARSAMQCQKAEHDEKRAKTVCENYRLLSQTPVRLRLELACGNHSLAIFDPVCGPSSVLACPAGSHGLCPVAEAAWLLVRTRPGRGPGRLAA